MPFRSEAQRRWMWANDPEMARRWEKETPKGKRLPDRVPEDDDEGVEQPKKRRKPAVSKSMEGTIRKVDEDRRLVFGWAYVSHDPEGRAIIDKQGDFFDDPEELAKSAYDFVLNSRVSDALHLEVPVADLVESFFLTPEKAELMGLSKSVPTGWWVGFRVNDDMVWGLVKSGHLRAFSIGGTGIREKVEA